MRKHCQQGEPNGSVLQCPRCKKALVNIGSKVTRIHPIARIIQDHYTQIVVISGFIFTALLLAMYAFRIFPSMRGGAFALLTLICTPSFVMYFLLRCFSLYRVTHCPYCGFKEVQRLGRSGVGT